MKKFLSSLLTVVLLFSAVPFSTTVKSALGVADASAMETVAGSYDYAIKYFESHGRKDSYGKYYFENVIQEKDGDFTARIVYDPEEELFYGFVALRAFSTGVTSYMLLGIEKDKNSYIVILENDSSYGKDEASVIINPSTYNNSKKFSYDYSEHIWNSSKTKTATDNLLDATIHTGVSLIDDLMFESFGFGLGNFGFTNISNPTPVPETVSTVSFWDSIVNFFKMIIDFFRNLFSAVVAA